MSYLYIIIIIVWIIFSIMKIMGKAKSQEKNKNNSSTARTIQHKKRTIVNTRDSDNESMMRLRNMLEHTGNEIIQKNENVYSSKIEPSVSMVEDNTEIENYTHDEISDIDFNIDDSSSKNSKPIVNISADMLEQAIVYEAVLNRKGMPYTGKRKK